MNGLAEKQGIKRSNGEHRRGLSEAEVFEAREKYGENLLKKRGRRSFFSCFVSNLGDPVIRVLLVALAVNLAVMNLLPIPALDGGRIVFLVITAILEKILKRKINPKYEGYIHAATMILLFGFIAFITLHDIGNLIGR